MQIKSIQHHFQTASVSERGFTIKFRHQIGNVSTSHAICAIYHGSRDRKDTFSNVRKLIRPTCKSNFVLSSCTLDNLRHIFALSTYVDVLLSLAILRSYFDLIDCPWSYYNDVFWYERLRSQKNRISRDYGGYIVYKDLKFVSMHSKYYRRFLSAYYFL